MFHHLSYRLFRKTLKNEVSKFNQNTATGKGFSKNIINKKKLFKHLAT